ncbi:MAG: molybdopterin-dependent oxidoreductase, partial [Pseudomonadota bacterium]
TKTQSIDVMDALGSNIRVDTRGREVMRILPRNHDGVNEEWLADRSRYIWDGLRRQRLDRPYVRVDGKLEPATWSEAFAAIAAAKKSAGESIAAVAGDLVPVEAMWALKSLLTSLGSDRVECRQDGAALPIGNRSAYVGTGRIEDLDTSDTLIIGSNPRNEAPVLNSRIRKAWLAGHTIAMVGEPVDLSYPVAHAGSSPAALNQLEPPNGEAAVILIGQGALKRRDGASILAKAMKMAESQGAKLLVLHTAASRVGGMDIGFAHPDGLGCLDGAAMIWNLGADECVSPEGAFVVYQGHHGDRGAHRADVILPGAAYTEQSGLFVNTEGRVQMAARAGFPPGEAKEDWAILRAASTHLGQTLPFNSLAALRAALFEAHPHFAAVDEIAESEWTPLPAGDIDNAPFKQALGDHYLTNPITRASQMMSEMSRLAQERHQPMAAE